MESLMLKEISTAFAEQIPLLQLLPWQVTAWLLLGSLCYTIVSLLAGADHIESEIKTIAMWLAAWPWLLILTTVAFIHHVFKVTFK